MLLDFAKRSIPFLEEIESVNKQPPQKQQQTTSGTSMNIEVVLNDPRIALLEDATNQNSRVILLKVIDCYKWLFSTMAVFPIQVILKLLSLYFVPFRAICSLCSTWRLVIAIWHLLVKTWVLASHDTTHCHSQSQWYVLTMTHIGVLLVTGADNGSLYNWFLNGG